MSKQKHEPVVIGVITVAAPYTALSDIAKAEAIIRGLELRGVRLVSVATRLGKLPVAEPVTTPDMPAIPTNMRRT